MSIPTAIQIFIPLETVGLFGVILIIIIALVFKKIFATVPLRALLLHPNGFGQELRAKEQTDGTFVTVWGKGIKPREIKVMASASFIHLGGARVRRLFFITDGIDETIDLAKADSALKGGKITGAAIISDSTNALRMMIAAALDTAKGTMKGTVMPMLTGISIGGLIGFILARVLVTT